MLSMKRHGATAGLFVLLTLGCVKGGDVQGEKDPETTIGLLDFVDVSDVLGIKKRKTDPGYVRHDYGPMWVDLNGDRWPVKKRCRVARSVDTPSSPNFISSPTA